MSYTGTTHKSYLVDTNVSVGEILNMEKNVITQTYRVVKYDLVPTGNPPPGISLPYGLDNALADTSPQSVLPIIGAAFADTSPPSATWQTSALCRGHQAQKYDKYMEVRATFDTYYHWLAGAKGNNAGSIVTVANDTYLPAKVSYQVKTRQTNLWRAIGTAPSATSDSVTTTTGAYVGQGATPIRADVACMSIRVQLMCDSEQQSPLTNSAVILSYIGKRNADTFLGYTQGQLVCTGGSLSHLENEYYLLSMEYEYDEYFEHNQVCAVNNANQITLTAGNPTTVYWRRPTRSSVNFNNLWGSGAQAHLWRYICENGRYW